MIATSWTSAGTTDIGTVRKVNEDNYLDASSAGVWCVADGMGGHEKGDLASQMIIDSLSSLLKQQHYPLNISLIKQQLLIVNDNLVKLAHDMPKSSVIGSTVAVLVFDEQEVTCIWAGDSRIYRLRAGELNLLTRDHSQVEEMVKSGALTPEQALRHPASNVITRAVGAADLLELEIKTYSLNEQDRFLLCSDGLNKVMADEEIADYLGSSKVTNLPKTLIKLAVEREARDNVTVVVVSNQMDETDLIASEELNQRSSIQNTNLLDETLPLR